MRFEPTYLLAKAIVKPWMGLWFRWYLEGLENIPRRGAAILAFNHIAFLDPFASAYAVDLVGRRPRYLAKSELFQDKRVAWILRGAAQIEVRRGTKEAPMALDHAVDALARGELIVVFPEGTITTDPELNPMPAKTGAARLALASGAPLIPCALWGTQNVWPKGYAKHWWPPRQELAVRVGTPMRVSGNPQDLSAWERISSDLTEQITLLLATLKPALPDRRRSRRRAA